MTYNEPQIVQLLKNHIAAEFMHDPGQANFSDDLQLFEEGIIDSLGIFLLINFLEAQFGIKVAPDEVILENFETVGTIKNLVVTRLNGS